MDYKAQSKKEQPFSGLLPVEKKRLYVYMCYVMHPALTPEEIERKWGMVLSAEEKPTVFEALEIADDLRNSPHLETKEENSKPAAVATDIPPILKWVHKWLFSLWLIVRISLSFFCACYADLSDKTAVPFNGLGDDWYTLDLDFDWSRTVAYGERTGQPFTSRDIISLNVFGKTISANKLRETNDGHRLLELAEITRKGTKRGFLTALSEVSVSDLPFVGMVANVRNSFRDAKMVSDVFHKLRNGEDVSDEELIKARLYMAEQEYRSNDTTFMGMVGDWSHIIFAFYCELIILNSFLDWLMNMRV